MRSIRFSVYDVMCYFFFFLQLARIDYIHRFTAAALFRLNAIGTYMSFLLVRNIVLFFVWHCTVPYREKAMVGLI